VNATAGADSLAVRETLIGKRSPNVPALSVTCISALFFSVEFAEADPQAPKRLRASARDTIRIIGAAEIVAVKHIEAAGHSGTSNSESHSS
jgi:hypothetical protein